VDLGRTASRFDDDPSSCDIWQAAEFSLEGLIVQTGLGVHVAHVICVPPPDPG